MKRIERFSLWQGDDAINTAIAKPLKAKQYNRRWQKIRLMHLAKEPLCRHCLQQGKTTAATDVDHILRLNWGGTNAEANLQSLCHSCHAKKTQAERRPTGR